ncbi:unnamed protein product, partial [Effrenium voratum]
MQLVGLDLRSEVSTRLGGHEGHADTESKAQVVSERRQLAALVDAVEHDLASLKEEAATHHELSEEQLKEVMEEIDLALQNCRDESKLLQSSSPLQGMPESLLQSLAEALGLVEGSKESLASRRWVHGETPLHWAAALGRRDVIEYLLRQEGGTALLHARDREGHTPAELAEQRHQVSVAQFLYGHMEMNPRQEGVEERLPPAYREVLKQVVASGWDSVRWKEGFSMLHWAASKGEVDLARYLLQLRADPDARDDTHQRTPLDWAEHEGHVEAAEMLRRQTRSRLLGRLSTRRKTFQQERSSLPVQQGQAVPAPRRKSEAAPRRRSRRKSVMPESYIPVLEEIDRRGWNNMQWTNGFTLLHWAAQNDQPDLVEQLFTKAADPLQKDDAGRTALDFARESGSLAVVEALKRYSPPAPE